MFKQYVKNEPATASGTVVTLQELIELRKQALHHTQVNIKKRLSLPGERCTRVRGHGLEFDATREYQAGDDIRSMAWRVTARNLKPHVKVYREDKERPVWLAVDLSPSLYFGTRCVFKSVKSIMQATLTGWSSLLQRERIGAMVTTAQQPLVFQPRLGEKYFLTILNSLAESSRWQPTLNEQPHLHHLLLSLQQHTRSGSLIYIYSDFLQYDAETEKLILYLAQRSQVILHFVYDPFEAVPPLLPYQYMLTNGQQKMLFNMQDAKNREDYSRLFQMKVQQLRDFARKHQITLNLHCTDPAREEEI